MATTCFYFDTYINNFNNIKWRILSLLKVLIQRGKKKVQYTIA
jgi:hypothetical protein